MNKITERHKVVLPQQPLRRQFTLVLEDVVTEGESNFLQTYLRQAWEIANNGRELFEQFQTRVVYLSEISVCFRVKALFKSSVHFFKYVRICVWLYVCLPIYLFVIVFL